MASALWFGGQIYIAIVLISALGVRSLRPAGTQPETGRPVSSSCTTGAFLDTLDRFSPVAYASIALFALTGPFNAKIHIPSWYAFFNSIYGRALIAKIGLIGLMMLVSANHVYRLRPRLRLSALPSPPAPLPPAGEGAWTEDETASTWDSPSPTMRERGLGGEGAPLIKRLTAWLRFEPCLGAGVLLAVSVMFYYPVPAGFGPTGPSVYTVRAAGLVAGISIKPDHAGPNQITVSLRNRQGQPVRQATVVALPTMLDMPMGTGRSPLTQTRPGQYTGTADLGMGGRWRLEILIFQPSGLARMFVDVQVGT
jgi:copper transport protein